MHHPHHLHFTQPISTVRPQHLEISQPPSPPPSIRTRTSFMNFPLQYITIGSLTCTILSQEHRLERRRQGLTEQATTAVVARENAFGSLTPRSWCSGSMTRSRTCWTDDATARWTLSLWKRSEMSICIIIYICGGQVVNESLPCN